MLSAQPTGAEHEIVAKIWDEILSEKPTETERFLRCYFSSMQGQRPGQSSLFDDFVNAFFPTYNGAPLSTQACRTLVKQVTTLRDEYRRYSKIVEGIWPYPPSTHTKPVEKERLPMLVNVLDHELCHPLLLAAGTLDESKFKEVVQLVERIAFRYKYVCNGHVGSLTAVYLKQAKAIRDSGSSYRPRDMQQAFFELQERRAPAELFSSSLDRLVYHDSGNNRPVKYFLLTAEYYWRWFQDGANGHPKYLDPNLLIDADSTTIEHIYSRSPGAIEADMAELTNDLGNLTLLSQPDNDRVANKAFSQKQTVYRSSSFRITKPLADLTTWNAVDVTSRRTRLREFATRIFTFVQPSQQSRRQVGAAGETGAGSPRPRVTRGSRPKSSDGSE